MKSRYYLLVVLFAIFSLPEQTVAQSTQELLIGTWSFNYDSSISKMEAEMKVRLETMPQTQRSSIEKAYKNRKITFYANGNYLISISDGSQAAGSWILTENGNTIKMTSSKGSAFIQNIERLFPTQLVLKPRLNGQEKAFITEWHYTKN